MSSNEYIFVYTYPTDTQLQTRYADDIHATELFGNLRTAAMAVALTQKPWVLRSGFINYKSNNPVLSSYFFIFDTNQS